MELSDQNQFKVKAFYNASNVVKTSPLALDDLIEQASQKKIRGLGPQTLNAITEIVKTGGLKELQDLRSKFSPTYLEILKIKGLGVKTLRSLNLKLGVESIQDLEKLCLEGKLGETKGFGEKTQSNFLQAITLYKSFAGKLRLDQASIFSNDLIEEIRKLNPKLKIQAAGQLKENCEIVEHLQLLALTEDKINLGKFNDTELNVSSPTLLEGKGLNAIKLSIETTVNELEFKKKTEQSFKSAISTSDLKGILHVHTTYSDGADSLRTICQAAKDKGYQYIGISDHSKTASYARGLPVAIIKKQQEEIAKLNEELAPFQIFSGIESDILADGSLDYPDDILENFDFIISSIHSGFNISKDEMTKRMLSALENKYTTILAHPTGRLLLEREGYQVDLELLIKRAGELGKAIELNCNPKRLELDWRFHELAKASKIQVPISPDAHSIQNLDYVNWGVMIANKGGLTPSDILNCKTLNEIKDYLNIK